MESCNVGRERKEVSRDHETGIGLEPYRVDYPDSTRLQVSIDHQAPNFMGFTRRFCFGFATEAWYSLALTTPGTLISLTACGGENIDDGIQT